MTLARVAASLEQEFNRHCLVIDNTDWPRHERRQLKKQIKHILERDGSIDTRHLTPSYRWNLCSTRLRDGDFTNWDGWEFRSDWAMTFRWGTEKCSPLPKWDGGPCDHLVILGEQGVGDEILFLSALPELLIRLGTKSIEVQCYEALAPIVARSFKVRCTERLPLSQVTQGKAVAALGDLFPWYRRDKSHFPRKPFLKPDPEKVEYWKEWLGSGKHIGYAWKSRHGYLGPRDFMFGGDKYWNLQYDVTDENSPPFDVKNDFENLFAFVSALDKVHTVTQTLAHVAGSIGKECHAVIPPKNGEVSWPLWYYGHGGPSVVYPNLTIYRDIDEFRTSRP